MLRRSYTAHPRVAGSLVALAVLVIAGLAAPGGAAAAPRLHPPAVASASSSAEASRIAAYWTPARMRSAVPLDRRGRANPLALASFTPVPDATVPPFTANGRIFVRQGRRAGFCSGTAINSASRRLVITAGHCANSGPRGRSGSSAWSRFLVFVPAYTDGAAPFGTFIARRPEVFAPKPWVKQGNPNFDMGAVLTQPNEAGVNVADAVGGGVTIGLDLPPEQEFRTFGYPGKVKRLQECDSPSVGEDKLTRGIPGHPTVAIRCHWLPGASGGGWLVENGTVIDGLTSYGRNRDRVHTFGPYFSAGN